MLQEKLRGTDLLGPEAGESFARVAGLKYVRDGQPGFRRRRTGKKSFGYYDEHNRRISNEATLQRIRKLAIPPAWKDVWICKSENGHLQATGRDARGRKQYRYHPMWTQLRNETKFSKMFLFGRMLPKIRERVELDLKRPGYPKEKVLAAVIRVMELTRIRVGNDQYAEENGSYGLTTIRNEHARVRGAKVGLRFKGKSGILHEESFSDPHLSRIIRKCQELPGEELFTYIDENGQAQDIGSSDVNEYLRAITGEPVTAKDFRTWGGTVHVVEVLAQCGPCALTTKKAWKAREIDCYKEAAKHLRNTVAVCRKYYVHPCVFEADKCGELHRLFKKAERKKARSPLSLPELVTMEILKKQAHW
jgi:DNA topoisomerase-1